MWQDLSIREITSLDDLALPALFDIYQTSFPAEEQMLTSFFLDILARKARGESAIGQEIREFM